MGFRVRGMRTLATAGRWLRSRLGDRAIILLYHRVGRSGADPFRLAVAPERFAEQMEALRRCASVISLTALCRMLREGRVPHRAVAVTFDDGYADNLHTAVPVLERFEVPATIFAVTGRPGLEFWWDELSRIVFSSGLSSRELHLSVGRRSRSWTLPAASARQGAACHETKRVFLSIYQGLQELEDTQRRAALEQLAASGRVASPDPSHRALTASEVLGLVSRELFTLGAHTVTHPLLPRMTPTTQRDEIVQSKSSLESLIGGPVETFSYPNGAASALTASLVSEAGFACACGTALGAVGTTTDPYRLPRLWVGDWDGREFERRMLRWLDD